MAHPLRFQVLALPNASAPELIERYRLIERLGFDVAGIADHFVDWTNPPSPWLEATALWAALARETSTLRLGTCVAQIPLRNPALFAHQALTIDHLSGGRVEVGLGIGLTSDPSYEMMGLPNWSNRERVARFAEYVDVVAELLGNEVTTYTGKYYQVTGAVMNPRPVQQPRPPIVIAAMGPKMLRIAAAKADIWNSLSFKATFDEQLAETRERIARIDEACRSAGRDPATLRRSYLMFDASARPSGGRIAYYTSDALFEDMTEQLVALGISEIGVYFPALDEQRAAFERIATELIPAIRNRHRARV